MRRALRTGLDGASLRSWMAIVGARDVRASCRGPAPCLPKLLLLDVQLHGITKVHIQIRAHDMYYMCSMNAYDSFLVGLARRLAFELFRFARYGLPYIADHIVQTEITNPWRSSVEQLNHTPFT